MTLKRYSSIKPGVSFRGGAGLLVGATLYLLVLFVLEKTGVPRQYAIGISAAALVIAWLLPSLAAGTTRADKFALADRAISANINAMAITTAVMLPLFSVFGASIYFEAPEFLVLLAGAMTTGVALSALLVSRKLRASEYADFCALFMDRYRRKIPATIAGLGVAFAATLLLIAAMTAGATLLGWFFALRFPVALTLFAGAVGFTAMIGGLAAVSRLAALAMICFIVALNLPLLLHSLETAGLPIGHLTFGYGAVEPVATLESQLRSVDFPLLDAAIEPASAVFEWGPGRQIAAALLVALALAVLPQIGQQYAAATAPERASDGAMKAILTVGFTALSLVALAAYTRLGIYETLLGLSPAEAGIGAPFLYEWSAREPALVQLCGNVAATFDQLATICGDGGALLSLDRLRLESRLLLAAAPDLSGLPFALTGFMTLSILLLTAAFSAMSALAVANHLAGAGRALMSEKERSGRLFGTRLLILLAAVLAGTAGWLWRPDAASLTLFALALLAATLLPALVSALYWRKASAGAAVLAMVTGFAVTLVYYVLGRIGVNFKPGDGDELSLALPGLPEGVPAELGALFGLPIGIIALLLAVALEPFSAGKTVQVASKHRSGPQQKKTPRDAQLSRFKSWRNSFITSKKRRSARVE